MYKLILPIRYFVSRRITLLAIAAIALCVFIVVVVMTVMNGMVDEFRNKNHEFAGDCVVSTDSLVGFAYYDDFLSRLDEQEFIKAASAAVKSFALLAQPGIDNNMGAEIMGIEPGSFAEATGFGKTLYYNRENPADAFAVANAPEKDGCVLGIEMTPQPEQSRSGGYSHSPSPPRIKLTISCFPLTVKGGLAKAGTDLVNTKVFYYSDDSHSGLVKVDSQMVYLPIDIAQKLTGMAGPVARVNSIHIKFADGIDLADGCGKVAKMWEDFKADHRGKKHANLLKNVTVQSWIEYRRWSIAPMEKEQAMLIMLFIMIGFITVFVVFVVFYMIICHKSKDIGILKSLGVSGLEILSIFMVFSILVAIVGSAIGAAAGCGFLVKINDIEDWLFASFGWQLWDRTVYAIGDIPNDVKPDVLGIIIASAMLSSLAGAVLPCISAARRQPVEILQVNQL